MARLTTVERLDEIPGIGQRAAQMIIAEIGLDMSRFPTPEHLVSWAKLCPRTIQSGPVTRGGNTGKGNPYLKGALGEAAAAAAKTNTFLGERYRRIVKRRGKLKALVAVARSILVIVWNLLDDPTARFHDLGPTTTPPASTPNAEHAQPHRPTHRDGLPRHPRTRRLIQIRTRTTSPGSASPAGCFRLPTHLGYFSDQGEALRTETTINDPHDFRLPKRLTSLPALRQLGFTANRRLLGVQSVSHDPIRGAQAFTDLTTPILTGEGTRIPGLRFGDNRVHALLQALLIHRLLPNGFTNRDLRTLIAPLLGTSPEDITAGKMTYDLRRLRAHGLN